MRVRVRIHIMAQTHVQTRTHTHTHMQSNSLAKYKEITKKKPTFSLEQSYQTVSYSVIKATSVIPCPSQNNH